MSARPIRNRLIPYKILVHLLYGRHGWLSRLPDGRIEVRTGPMSRSLRVTSSRLGEQLEWLKAIGLLSSIDTPSSGRRIIEVSRPDLDFATMGPEEGAN